jgi:hypothetical protein
MKLRKVRTILRESASQNPLVIVITDNESIIQGFFDEIRFNDHNRHFIVIKNSEGSKEINLERIRGFELIHS